MIDDGKKEKRYLVETVGFKMYNDKTNELIYEWNKNDGEMPFMIGITSEKISIVWLKKE